MEPSSSSTQLITKKRVILWLNCLLLFLGMGCGPLVMRLYFLHGGKSVWFQSFLQTAGFPILIIPTIYTLTQTRRRHQSTSGSSSSSTVNNISVLIPFRLFLSALGIGVMAGAGDFLYAKGIELIPVSTVSLILSMQLAFTAVFCYVIVKQKFTPYSVNALVLLTVAAGVLAMHTSSDRPAGQSSLMYFMGFFMTLAAAGIFAAMMPLIELAYMKAGIEVTYAIVMEVQLVMSFAATAFCAIGMAFSHDYHAVALEARNFGLGHTMYYVVLFCSATLWQGYYLGALGVIHFGSSLLCGVIIALCLPATEILAVIIYKEKFQSEKMVSLGLSVWGFISYFYGEIKQIRDNKNANNTHDFGSNKDDGNSTGDQRTAGTP